MDCYLKLRENEDKMVYVNEGINMDIKRQRINHLSLTKVIISLVMTILLWTLVTNAWSYTKIFFDAEGGSWVNYIYDFFSRLVWAAAIIVLLRLY